MKAQGYVDMEVLTDDPHPIAPARKGRMSVYIILPDGSGFKATATDDGRTVYSEQFTEAEMVAKLLSFYGLHAIKVQ
ncbi:hypothetical protein ACIQUG_03500 [Ensifer sp. NPDC090286]|uniref:hypothetical protein n=1 Tax=Ensifer sp. NPDC090286 TaxID=3363991 RepID=UPI00383A3244